MRIAHIALRLKLMRILAVELPLELADLCLESLDALVQIHDQFLVVV